MQIVDLHDQGFFLEPVPVTCRAGATVLVFAQLFSHPVAVSLTVPTIHVVDQPFEWPGGAISARAVVVNHGDGILAGAIQDDVALLGFQLIKGGIEVKAIVRTDGIQRLHVILRR